MRHAAAWVGAWAVVLVLASCGHPAGYDGTASLSGDGVVCLDGTWSLQPASGGQAVQVRVPAVWDSVVAPNGSATYSFALTGLSVGRIYALQFKGISSRAQLYLDDRALGEWGPAFNLVPQTYHWVAWSDHVVLRVEVQNPDMASGGLMLPVLAGPASAVDVAAGQGRFWETLMIGAVALMGLYQLVIFCFRVRDRSPLYFALFCLLSAFKASLSGEQVLAYMLPGLDQVVGNRAAYLLVIALPIVFLAYLHQLFPAKHNRGWLLAFAVAGVLQAALTVFAPLPVVQRFFFPYQALIVLGSVHCLLVLASALKNREPGASLMLAGFIVIFLSVVNDVLHDNKVIFTFYSLNFALVLFLFLQALTMGGLFSRTHGKLEELNATLERRVAERTKELEDLSRADPLTDLLNRRHFWVLLNQEWERWIRYRQDFCLAMVDIDHFKRINDTFGHGAGDVALLSVSKLLASKVRKSDIVARYGGEEFCLLLPGVNKHEAFQVLDKIRAAIESEPFLVDGRRESLTISFGVTQASDHVSAQESLNRADLLMYQAKQAGRNQGALEP